jgi:NADPH2:quinone reductase
MRAVVAASYGGPDVLEIVDLPTPRPQPGQVSIDVAYAGVNFAEVMGRRGDLGPQRQPFVPGLEVAGHVRAVGRRVHDLAPGHPVCAFVDVGGYAEVALADARLTFPLASDDDESLLRAACAPTIATTAWSLLRHAGRLAPGETLLVHAAAGGLGTLLGQFARHLEAGTILGTVATEDKVRYAEGFGYDNVLGRAGFAPRVLELTNGRGVDVVLDSVGGVTREQSLELLAPFGRLIACGNATRSEPWSATAAQLMGLNASLVGYSIGALAAAAPELVRAAALEAFDLLERGAARIEITSIERLANIRDVHQRLEAGATRGKMALDVQSACP